MIPTSTPPPLVNLIGQDPTCPDTAADQAGGGLGALSALLRQLVATLRPPWMYPPPGFQDFNTTNVVPTPAIGTSAQIIGPNSVNAVTFIVPRGWECIINRLSLNFIGGGFVQGSGNLVFSILVDTAPYKNYGAILTEVGEDPKAFFSLYPAGIRVRSNQRVTVIVQNVGQGGVGTSCFARLGGWFYPMRGAVTGSF